MAHRLTISSRAVSDLENIAEYISRDSIAYARAVVRSIMARIRMLRKHPRLGRVVPEFREENLREVFAYSYRIIYRIDGDQVIVLAVVHGRRAL